MDERFEQLLSIALKTKSSDIHFTIIDDEIEIAIKTINGLKKVSSDSNDFKLFNYLQYQSFLDVSNTKAQSGSFSYFYRGKYYDFRFSTMQSRNVKNGVLRILNYHDGLSLEQLTFQNDIRQLFQTILTRRSGLILFSGLTGNGKTTTMYSLLKMIKGKTIYSLEDPIEVVCDNMVQFEINEKINLGFNEGIRQILRHNPDVIMIGEIRDSESAAMAIRAALTGCLVFSSIHSSSTTKALRRLQELSGNLADVVEVLEYVFNQRLLKKYQENSYCCIFDYLDNCQISNYFNGVKVADRMIERIKQAETERYIDKVDSYE
ncbi:MAG: ATPase, T2SS/T4P/T4SS family [Erysipelotrichaceae bacterium]